MGKHQVLVFKHQYSEMRNRSELTVHYCMLQNYFRNICNSRISGVSKSMTGVAKFYFARIRIKLKLFLVPKKKEKE